MKIKEELTKLWLENHNIRQERLKIADIERLIQKITYAGAVLFGGAMLVIWSLFITGDIKF